VLASCAAAAALGEEGDAIEQLRLLDLAFVMGGPSDLLQPWVDIIEPRARALAPVAEPLPPFARIQPVVEIRHSPPRLHCPTAAEFKAYFQQDKACLLTGITSGWTALSKWADAAWWARIYGHRSIPLEVGRHNDEGWHESVSTLSSFVSRLSREREVLYLAQHTLFDHLPSLAGDIAPCPDVLCSRVVRDLQWSHCRSLPSQPTLTFCRHDGTCGSARRIRSHRYIMTATTASYAKLLVS
jgi:hypothetical protein